MSSALALALVSAAVLGFRHGFDYDHIAAITDITGIETSRRRAMGLGLFYVLGHAATVAVLGGAVIFFQKSLPARIDFWAERAVGVTLVLLGLYVLGSLSYSKSDVTPRSRAAIMIAGFRWMAWRLRKLFDAGAAEQPPAGNGNYTRRVVFLIGVIHGLGAETPSQLLLFLLAANLGGLARGFLGLGVFLLGLITMNTLMTASAVGLFGTSAARPRLLRVLTACTAAYSVIVGSIFLFGSANFLPPLGS
jgi:Ca2+/Na+ antiporter